MTRRAIPDDDHRRLSLRPFKLLQVEIPSVLLGIDGAGIFDLSIHTRFHQYRLSVNCKSLIQISLLQSGFDIPW